MFHFIPLMIAWIMFALAGLLPSAEAQELSVALNYDAATGHFSVNAVDANLVIRYLLVGSKQGLFTADAGEFGAFDYQRPNQLVRVVEGRAAAFDFGQSLPAGLDVDSLLDDLCVDGTFLQNRKTVRFTGAQLNGHTLDRIGSCLSFVRGYNAGTPEGGAAVIRYEATTGNLSVVTQGTGELPPLLTTLQIQSLGGIFTGEPAQGLTGAFDVDRDTQLFRLDPLGFRELDFGAVAAKSLSNNAIASDLCIAGSWLPKGAATALYQYPGAGLVEFSCKGAARTPEIDIQVDPSTRHLTVSLRPGDDEDVENGQVAAQKRDLFTTVEIRSQSGVFDPTGATPPAGGSFSMTAERILWHDELGLEQIDFGPVIAAGIDPHRLPTDLTFDAITVGGGVLGEVFVQVPEPGGVMMLVTAVGLLASGGRDRRVRGSNEQGQELVREREIL